MLRFTVCIFFLLFTPLALQAGSGIDETIGKVVSLDGDILRVVGEPLNGSGSHTVAVNIKNAPMYDLLTGWSVCTDFVHKEMCVRVAYDMDKNAVAVWFNVQRQNAAVMSVVVSDNIQFGQGYCVFLSACGKFRITLGPDTVISDRYGLLCITEVLPGQEYFVWVDMITASNPAIVYPDKVVLIDD